MSNVQLILLCIFYSVLIRFGESPLYSQLSHLDIDGNANIIGRLSFGSNFERNIDSSNVFIGFNAGISNIVIRPEIGLGFGYSNTYIGADAGLQSNNGIFNTFVGNGSGRENNGSRNTLIGIGAGARSGVGFNNTLVGDRSGLFSRGHSNTFLGALSGPTLDPFADGDLNTGVGFNSLNDLSIGDQNTAIGFLSGDAMVSGHKNTFIGTKTSIKDGVDSISQSIAIGYNAQVGCHHCAVIGGVESDAVRVGIGQSVPIAPLDIKQRNLSGVKGIRMEDHDTAEDWQIATIADFLTFSRNGVIKATMSPVDGMYTASDRRLKEGIQDLDYELGKILKLNPRKYHFRDAEGKDHSIGFIAQEVQHIFPELVATDSDYLTINYSGFTVLAIHAIKELSAMVQVLQAELNHLKGQYKSENSSNPQFNTFTND